MAAVVSRRSLPRHHSHLSTVPSPHQVPLPRSASVTSSLKRPRSPDYSQDPASLKRQRAAAAAAALHPPIPSASQQTIGKPDDDDAEIRREQRRLRKDAYKEEFKDKYTRAFPKWRFYLDTDVGEDSSSLRRDLVARIQSLGGTVEDFFSKDGITHFITNREIIDDSGIHSNKENHSRPSPSSQSALKSPIRLRGIGSPSPAEEPHSLPSNSLLHKAKSWNMKIWSVLKLQSVLDRCQAPSLPNAPKGASATSASLLRLLETERLYGTSERDPSQKRHDFHYFSKNTCYVLVEDMREELATVHAAEFPIKRVNLDGKEEGDWPVLYCHPDTRGPFCKPDEQEFKRARKQLLRDQEQDREAQRRHEARWERERRRAAEAERLVRAQNTGDLRRSVSMTNLRRRALSNAEEKPPDGFDLDGEGMESANASGYLRSTYVAASGNSVSVTSTTGTTTSAGNSLRTGSLSASLRGMQKQEVVTSLRVAVNKGKGDMGPPAELPQKTLRKSKSTTTMRLPKREEGAKPGYCENCRLRYNDFDEHIESRKHRKFAMNDENFEQLDGVIKRIQRPLRADYIRRQRLATPVDLEDSPKQSAHDLRSSSEVSDYLPQPEVDYTRADVGVADGDALMNL